MTLCAHFNVFKAALYFSPPIFEDAKWYKFWEWSEGIKGSNRNYSVAEGGNGMVGQVKSVRKLAAI